MTDRMRGPRAKIERAKEHVKELYAANERFSESKPYDLIPKDDGINLVQHVVIRKDIPAELSLIAGDALHNMRSALDLVFCQLVEANGLVIQKSDAFPIYDSRSKYESDGRGKIRKRISKDALQAIDGLKPYKGGNDALWTLHKLDIMDKHRAILTAQASFPQLLLQTNFPPDVLADAGISDAPKIEIPINVAPDKRGPLKDGDAVFECSLKDFEHYKGTKVLIQVAIHEPGIVECEPLGPFLGDLGGQIERIVDLFAVILAK